MLRATTEGPTVGTAGRGALLARSEALIIGTCHFVLPACREKIDSQLIQDHFPPIFQSLIFSLLLQSGSSTSRRLRCRLFLSQFCNSSETFAMSGKPVEILHPDGMLAPPETWFPDADSLPEDPFFIVAIMGPQASGKSTLVNALFETSFPVADRNQVGIATTRGILAERASDTDTPTIVLDVEGADARARGRDAKVFAYRAASFVSALADVVIVNLWFHDACRFDSSAYSLIRAVLNSTAQSLADDSPARISLIIAVRDVDDDAPESTSSLRDLITSDVRSTFLPLSINFHFTSLPMNGFRIVVFFLLVDLFFVGPKGPYKCIQTSLLTGLYPPCMWWIFF